MLLRAPGHRALPHGPFGSLGLSGVERVFLGMFFFYPPGCLALTNTRRSQEAWRQKLLTRSAFSFRAGAQSRVAVGLVLGFGLPDVVI